MPYLGHMKLVPDWVKKHKRKGVEIRVIGNGYYAYKRKSVWNSITKKPKTITEKYLGRITEKGFIEPKHEQILNKATIKEYGASKLIDHICKDIIVRLKENYPASWQDIFCMTAERFLNNSPLKNMQTHFIHSELSELYPKANMSPKNISNLLQIIGADRNLMVNFMKGNIIGKEHLIIDSTAIFSQAENIKYLSLGHNSQKEYLPQINMLLLFSKDKDMPVFFRLLPGSIPDVSSIKLTLEESEIKNAIFIGDKGFYSKDNVGWFQEASLSYILPLRRNSILIDYSAAQSSNKKVFGGYFFFNERPIWYKTILQDDKTVILFLDEHLKIEEQRGFLERVKKEIEGYSIEDYHENDYTFGTISVITNLKKEPEEIYSYLKSRLSIESAFDAFKNVLEADKTYMRTDNHMNGWMFMNFLSLQMYYLIYGILLKNKLLNNFSPKDIILHFSKVNKIILQDKEIITEVPKTTRTLIGKMGLDSSLFNLNNIKKPMP